MMQQGRCAACGTYTWRTVVAQKKNGDTEPGEVFIVWPIPTSVYAQTHVATDGPDTSHTAGIGYCTPCAPEFGAMTEHGPIIGYETAKARYAAWYADAHGEWLRAWCRDHISYDDVQISATMRAWERDRTTT